MEQRNEGFRGPKPTAADGSDLSLSQAELWLGLGTALAGLLRLVRRRSGNPPAASEGADGATAEGQPGDSSGREAA